MAKLDDKNSSDKKSDADAKADAAQSGPEQVSGPGFIGADEPEPSDDERRQRDMTPQGLMRAVESMHDSMSHFILVAERHALDASRSAEHTAHADFAKLALLFAEFRNGIGSVLITQ